MTSKTKTYMVGRRGFRGVPADAIRVAWRAPGGAVVIAHRGGSGFWALLDGPAPLVGRRFKNLIDARNAVSAARQTATPDSSGTDAGR